MGRSRRAVTLLFVAFALVMSTAQPGDALAPGSTQHKAKMDGAKVVPSGAGDPDGTGVFKLTLAPNAKNNRICWKITFSNVGTPTQLRITRGHPGEECLPNGCGEKYTQEILDFSPESGVKFCKFQDRKDVLYFQKHPKGYYAELETNDFPDGAIRGQLSGPL